MNLDMQVKPKLKYTVQMNRVNETILLRTSGITHAIEDRDKKIQTLFDLFNGLNSLADICTIYQQQCGIVKKESLEFIVKLDELKLLEDNRISPTDELSEYDLARWARNLNFFGSFCNLHQNKFSYQTKLKNSKITLLGLGGLGSHLLYDLAAMGFTNIEAVEFDNVELSNLNRQILYNEKDIGKPKAELAKKRIKLFNPNINFRVHNMKLAGTADVERAIKGSSLVICVADRPKMEILDWVNAACVNTDIPLITGGLDTQKARYYSMVPAISGCLYCWRTQVAEIDTFADQVLTDQRQNQLRGDNAAFVAFVAIIAGHMAAEAVKLITHITPPIAVGKVHEINFNTMEFSITETWKLNSKCPVCSSRYHHE